MQRLRLFSSHLQNNRMKRKFYLIYSVSFFVFLVSPLSGCMKDKIRKTYQIITPVYETLTKFREAIKSQPAVAITAPGKITVAEKYIFLAEQGKGIHVIDNSDPSVPRNVSFINIPGNEDLAITGSTLYADSYGDLVTFDIRNPLHVAAKNFVTNVFPDHNNYYYSRGYWTDTLHNPDSINVIIGWTARDTTVDYDPNGNYTGYYNSCPNCASAPSVFNANVSAPGIGTGVATNGSTARFNIMNSFLYTVGASNLTTFNISQPYNPSFSSSVQIDPHVETIYTLKNKLFIGTNNGMYMYDVQMSPATPQLAGEFVHLRACDPVIADDNYAYVTLNDASACLGSFNQLQIVDIHDLANSFLVNSYQLIHPEGLSKDGNNLFICDGKDGLKIFNVADVKNLHLIKQLKDADVRDIISQNGLAIVVAADGIYQYDYTDLNNVHLISKL
jgi:hypothetical protein